MAATFITGATGFIGSEVVRRILQWEPDREVHALVRAADQAEATRRGRETLFRLFFDDETATADARRRVHWVIGNVKAPGLGLAPADRARIVADCDELIHAAASTEWTLPLEAAEAVNVAGVEAMAALAAEAMRRPGGTRLLHVSTAYVVGRRDGLVRAADLPGPEGPFNNTYEQTKAQAERFLRARMGELPVTVVRPSIVVGDSTTGRTFNFNVIYFPIKLIHLGVLKVVPGQRSSALDIVPVDYVADALLALARDPAAVGRTFNLTADEDAMPLEEFLDRVVAVFAERQAALLRAGGSAPDLVRPRVAGRARWTLLRWWLRHAMGRQARRKFDAFETYLPYVFTTKRFVAQETREALGSRVPYPPLASYLARVAEYAVTREWGREVSWDPGLMRELG